MIELSSEGDLWKLFGGPDHLQRGLWERSFAFVSDAVHIRGGHGKNAPIRLKDKSRLYLVIGHDRIVCVDQSRLLAVGKAVPNASVQYAGVKKYPG